VWIRVTGCRTSIETREHVYLFISRNYRTPEQRGLICLSEAGEPSWWGVDCCKSRNKSPWLRVDRMMDIWLLKLETRRWNMSTLLNGCKSLNFFFIIPKRRVTLWHTGCFQMGGWVGEHCVISIPWVVDCVSASGSWRMVIVSEERERERAWTARGEREREREREQFEKKGRKIKETETWERQRRTTPRCRGRERKQGEDETAANEKRRWKRRGKRENERRIMKETDGESVGGGGRRENLIWLPEARRLLVGDGHHGTRLGLSPSL